MGITLILVMGMLAFIINVGLFVKAKINLQNAVDAAAFSGAATQARQLTNIAYVNWEMRNTYKEWMFKYYVLGQLGLEKGTNNLSDGKLNSSPKTSFLLTPPNAVAGITSDIGFDKFNVPTICIHNNIAIDICPIYSLPGLPRFPALGVAGISEIHEAFVNKLVSEKSKDCTARTQINFLAALSWAYSSGIKEIVGAPLIATNRAGAWPESLELAMRMRNLEMIMNRPPVESITQDTVNNLSSSGREIGLNERPVKAFMSAYRNLGGGKYKNSKSGAMDELSASLKLTEIAPQPYHASAESVSGFLIPKTSFSYPSGGGFTAFDKHYIDLQVVPVNYATMFTTFVSGKNAFDTAVESEGSCRVSKSAIPIPGYLMGFVKNPQVLTYYAVKGEAEFTGLFFPSGGSRSFKLTAYAAAKPFGGRIGPKLFGFSYDGQSVIPRIDNNSKSASYISGIDLGIAPPKFVPGMPIPSSSDFWADNLTSSVGGVPDTNAHIKFGIPNMIYDFNNDDELDAQNGHGGVTQIQTIKQQMSVSAGTDETYGLYQSWQFKALKAALGGSFAGRAMTQTDLMKALVISRQVTKYDAANYLIPDKNLTIPIGSPVTNAAPTAKFLGPSGAGTVGFQYQLFAPLVGTDLLYTTPNQVGDIVISYMHSNDIAINTYLKALLDVGQTVYDMASKADPSLKLGAEAGQSIHAHAGISKDPIPELLVSKDPNDPTDPTCKQDMASKFNHFFRAEQTQCGIVPLKLLMIEYIDKKNTQMNGKYFYTSTYYNPLPTKSIMTAYYPGPRQGADEDAEAKAKNPIGVSVGGSDYSTRRNFYSTKFIPLSKLFFSKNSYKEDVFLESDSEAPLDATNLIQQNPIKDDSSTGLNNPFYSDF
jgi:hypothetical protein